MSEITLLTPERLRAIAAEGAREAVRSELPDAIRRGTEKPYMTKSELMQLTGWSDRKISYMKANRTIPFIRRGRTILFPTDDIYAYLEAGRVEAKPSG